MLDEQTTMATEPAAAEMMQCDDRESARGGIEPRELDQRLRSYARRRGALDAAEALDLVRAERIRLHLGQGCVTSFNLRVDVQWVE